MAAPAFARVAQRLGISLAEVDEMSIDDFLDEVDLIHYLYDIDNPPRTQPVEAPPTHARGLRAH